MVSLREGQVTFFSSTLTSRKNWAVFRHQTAGPPPILGPRSAFLDLAGVFWPQPWARRSWPLPRRRCFWGYPPLWRPLCSLSTSSCWTSSLSRPLEHLKRAPSRATPHPAGATDQSGLGILLWLPVVPQPGSRERSRIPRKALAGQEGFEPPNPRIWSPVLCR